MGVRDSWNELGTGGKILVGLLVGGVVVVVGLVLLVVLAAVVGSFVLGVGDASQSTTPTASFAFEHDVPNETAEITHDGGDSIPADELSVETDEGTVGWDDEDGTVTVGDSVVVDAARGTTIRVVWSDGSESMVLAQSTVP